MRVLLCGDVHLSDRAPSSRLDSYCDELLAKLAWIGGYANEQDLPLVIAGDLFHIKAPSRTSHALVVRTHEVLSKTTRGVWIVPGNHDLHADRLGSLDAQPLGVLSRMPGMRLLMGADPDLPGIFGVPYLSEFDGGDWKKVLAPWLTLATEAQPELVVTHAPIFPPGKAPSVYASVNPKQWAVQWHGIATHTYYGHIHDPHDVFTVDSGIVGAKLHTFANFGAISRGSLHEETVNRWPTVSVFDAGTFTPVPLPDTVVKPAEAVFRFAEAELAKIAKGSAEEFAAALGAVKLANLTVEEVLHTIKQQTTDPLVLKIVEESIEHASS